MRDINVTSSTQQIDVRPVDPQEIVVEQPETAVSVILAGPQGPPGPPGSSGAIAYVHDQIAPSSVWTINHNLGVKPIVEAFTPGGLLMIVEVLHTSINQTLLTFNTPTAGFARLI